jgi:cyclopropane fatty-acyl-phospholipid synthase-like methyltransferase
MSGPACFSCGSRELEAFYEQLQIPVHSCLMLSTREEALSFPRGDLRLDFCRQCGFIQNSLFDPTVHDYSPAYEETQGFSPRFRRFQTELCRQQVEKYELGPERTVLEIGCGKGEFLVELCEIGGCRGIGIDPGYRPERTRSKAAERIQFIQDFYSESYTHLTADYICCRHTLEHIQQVRAFMEMVHDTLEAPSETIVFFEIPDMERILVEQAFEDIYYEHCTYFTSGSLARLFRSCGFEVLDLYKGFEDQYLMIEARPGDALTGKRFECEHDLEKTTRQVKLFQQRIGEKFVKLRSQLESGGQTAGSTAIWGSGSKAVSYLATLGIRDEIECVVDINPHKHGKFLAGTGHEIVAPEFLKRCRPEHVIVMNAIYIDEIREDLKRMGLHPRISAV